MMQVRLGGGREGGRERGREGGHKRGSHAEQGKRLEEEEKEMRKRRGREVGR